MKRRGLVITLDFALRSAGGLLLALPVAGVVAGTGIGRFPEGDRLLFQSGGLILAEVVRALAGTAVPLGAASLGSLIVLSVALVVPHSAVLVALSEREESSRARFWGRALECVPTLLVLGGFGLLVQAAAWLVGSALASGAFSLFASAAPPRADLAAASGLGLGALLALGVGVARDLCRAAAVVHGLDGKGALEAGLKALRDQPLQTLPAFFGPLTVAILVVLSAGVFVGVLDVSRPGSWRLWSVLIVHQAAAYALAWCRALWLSSSIDLVAQPSVSRR